eukprot:471389-Pelagomonas_calceolata.AAC.6
MPGDIRSCSAKRRPQADCLCASNMYLGWHCSERGTACGHKSRPGAEGVDSEQASPSSRTPARPTHKEGTGIGFGLSGPG